MASMADIFRRLFAKVTRPNATALACAFGLVFAGEARSQAVVEIGDAGETLSTYETFTGTGALTQITGNLSSETDSDLFRIHISDPAHFSVTTVGNPSISPLSDPQLFLFRLDGTGILAND